MGALENIIFLDIDGVFNCQLHYETDQFLNYRKNLKSHPKDKAISIREDDMEWMEYYCSQISEERVKWFNHLCESTNSKVVISSTWRFGKSISFLQKIFDKCGGTFEIIDKTPNSDCRVRGVEIRKWLEENTKKYFDVNYYDFHRYVIIDDDSDMLLDQGPHFFQTDSYSGLTPITCDKARKFLTHKTF